MSVRPTYGPGLAHGIQPVVHGEGLKELLATNQLQELRVFRNFADISPKVTAMLFFPDARSAIQAADSTMWRDVVGNLTRWKCRDRVLTVLVPSPVIPEVMKP